MAKIKSKEELDKKVEELRASLDVEFDANIADIKKFFKDKFNPNILKIGDHATFYLKTAFHMSPEIKRKFKNDPIQPITITYIRQDVIFFTYDKRPDLGEEYTMYDADWSKWLYPSEIKLSELWENKSYLKEKDYNEWYIETHLFRLGSKFTKVIDDIQYKIDIPKNIDEVFNYFDKELTDDDKEQLKQYSAIKFHNTLGRWIRNNFELWNPNNKLELKAWLIDKGFTHPDDMSNYIIEEYQKHLKYEQ